MLYFVRPFGGLEWTANVGQNVIDMARENAIDLGQLSDWWQKAERPAADDDVRVALRYGIEASGGIVVAAIHVVRVQGPNEFQKLAAKSEATFAAYRADPQVKAVDAWIEQMSPGWTEHGREIDRGVAESMRKTLVERQTEAAEELGAPVKAELVAHWRSIGGFLPNPL